MTQGNGANGELKFIDVITTTTLIIAENIS